MPAVMTRQLYTSGVVQAVRATRKGFPDHLLFEELLNRYMLIIDRNSAGAQAARSGRASSPCCSRRRA